MSSIKIETGLKTYDIEDENGTVRGQVSFNPSDANLIKRADEVGKKIEELINEASKIDNNPNIRQEDFINMISQIDKDIRTQINYLFDSSNVSNVVFGEQNVLTTVNGKTFVERFLEAFIPIIREEFEKEQKKSQDRIDKYVNRVK